jgi:hypothetical protein
MSDELACDALPSPVPASGMPTEQDDLLLTSLMASQTDSVSFFLKLGTYGRFLLGFCSSGAFLISSG